MPEPVRWHRESALPVAGGLLWLWCAASFGVVGFLFSLLPGCLLLASGVSTLLYPGDRRIPQYTALGGALGVPLALPAFWVAGPLTGLALVALSAASFVAAGGLSVRQEPPTEDAPAPRPSARLAAEVALDDALLALMGLTLPMPAPGAHARIGREVHAARELFGARGWVEEPEGYHAAPPPLEAPEIRRARARGLDFEHLRFESGYEPRAEEPGRERWLARAANRSAHAWVLRHSGEARPWLVCVHGYQMGWPAIDFFAFRAARLHHRLGLNLVFPVLPLHGPRKAGRISGDGFLAGDVLDTLHAEAQAMWDLRRLLGWLRAQGATRVGVHGLSLGGYNTALLASLDDALDFALPGIPAVDVLRLTWRHGPPLRIRHAEEHGVVHDAVSEVLRPVSPLALEPRVPREGRFLFAANADLLTPPDHARDLWRHWERPPIVWYAGGHLTFRLHPEVQSFFEEGLRKTGLVA